MKCEENASEAELSWEGIVSRNLLRTRRYNRETAPCAEERNRSDKC